MPDATDTQTLHCPTCYSTDFQASRPRPEDRLRMLTLKLPVRCRNCNTRLYASRAWVKTLPKSEHSSRESSKLAPVK